MTTIEDQEEVVMALDHKKQAALADFEGVLSTRIFIADEVLPRQCFEAFRKRRRAFARLGLRKLNRRDSAFDSLAAVTRTR